MRVERQNQRVVDRVETFEHGAMENLGVLMDCLGLDGEGSAVDEA